MTSLRSSETKRGHLDKDVTYFLMLYTGDPSAVKIHQHTPDGVLPGHNGQRIGLAEANVLRHGLQFFVDPAHRRVDLLPPQPVPARRRVQRIHPRYGLPYEILH